jgi:hypothetical protein
MNNSSEAYNLLYFVGLIRPRKGSRLAAHLQIKIIVRIMKARHGSLPRQYITIVN